MKAAVGCGRTRHAGRLALDAEGLRHAHLVNLTNPMTMKGPIREIIPAPRQQARIRVPDGRRVRKAHFLVSGKTPVYREAGGVVNLTVPSIDLHEVIALDLAWADFKSMYGKTD